MTATTKKPPRRGLQPGPRSLRIVSSKPVVSPASAAGVERTEHHSKPESDGKDELPTAFDIKDIKFVDGVAQLPIAMLTLDVPLIPFKRKVIEQERPVPFPFFELPSELRIKVYEHYFSDVDYVLDLDPTNYRRYHKLLGFMRVCKQIHSEASYLFYSTHSFRIFPVHHARQKHKKPILFRLKPRQRECLSTLDVRFGPNWGSPPRSWAVNDTLGLKDCVNVTQLNVFVECDPSDGIFKGWVRKEGFYETFTKELLGQVIRKIPSLRVVQFDAWPSVKKHGRMMTGLLDVVMEAKLMITWGPERGWTDALDEDVEEPPRANIWDAISNTPSSFSTSNLLVMA